MITGASSGFGRGLAVRLGAGGGNVVLAARRTGLLEEVAREVRAAGGTPLVVTADVAKPGDVTRLADAAAARFGRIDVWVNNAGVGVIGRFWDAPVEDYSRLVDINLKGVIYGSHAAVRRFRAQGYGTLVNTGSMDSETPLAYQAAYSATKAGVLSLGRALNEELRLNGHSGIKVATVMPWAADTPWWGHAANHSGGTRAWAPWTDRKRRWTLWLKPACTRVRKCPPAGRRGPPIFPTGWRRISPNVFPPTPRTATTSKPPRPPRPPEAPSMHRCKPDGEWMTGCGRASNRRRKSGGGGKGIERIMKTAAGRAGQHS